MRTAEFVTPKHPDKLCDIISDSILDLFLVKDPYTQCSIQTMGGFGKIWVTGEIHTNVFILDSEIKNLIKTISGYTDIELHINQNPNKNPIKTNDQGIIIGYATTETKSKVPFEYELARELCKYIYSIYPYDGKTQVTINGTDAKVVASFQNTKSEDLEKLVYSFFQTNSKKITNQLLKISEIYCNPHGDWVIGSLDNDTGISGAKNVIDNYGPRIPIGGGSFSGKDPSHIDRCGAYMARKIAIDSLIKYGLSYSLVELSYTMGNDTPIQARIKGNDKGINVETGVKLFEITDYDLSINGIIDLLDLRKPIFKETTEWGPFGNNFYRK